jgi:hypothetical protein
MIILFFFAEVLQEMFEDDNGGKILNSDGRVVLFA